MRKGFAPPLVLVIAALAAGALVITKLNSSKYQTIQPTAQVESSQDPYPNWKTYKNKTYNFTIRYPRELFAKEYGDYAVDFLTVNPKLAEASPAAIRASYRSLKEPIDFGEFEKIYNAATGAKIYEPLDVVSIITKNSNMEFDNNPTVNFIVNRRFTALEGPKTQFSHVYEIKKGDAIMKFSSITETEDEHKNFDPIFQKIISSLKF